jgi:hypothetical protein
MLLRWVPAQAIFHMAKLRHGAASRPTRADDPFYQAGLRLEDGRNERRFDEGLNGALQRFEAHPFSVPVFSICDTSPRPRKDTIQRTNPNAFAPLQPGGGGVFAEGAGRTCDLQVGHVEHFLNLSA